jgi:hypothetical protein
MKARIPLRKCPVRWWHSKELSRVRRIGIRMSSQMDMVPKPDEIVIAASDYRRYSRTQQEEQALRSFRNGCHAALKPDR